MEAKIVYHHVVQVYLEGQKALLPVPVNEMEPMIYWIGDSFSKLKVHDYRKNSNDHARRAIIGVDQDTFSESFSKPAEVVIQEEENDITIELFDTQGETPEFPILWMGVFEGDSMTANPLKWYRLGETRDERTAFAALVIPQVQS